MTVLTNALCQGRKYSQKRREIGTCAFLGLSRLKMRRLVRAVIGRQLTPEQRRQLTLALLARTLRLNRKRLSAMIRRFVQKVREAAIAMQTFVKAMQMVVQP